MAEVLVTFTEPTRSANGDLYYGRVVGKRGADGLWHGWIEFVLAGSDELVITKPETVQPNNTDLKYWAQGLTAVYLEGALARALQPAQPVTPARATGESRAFGEPQPEA